MSRTKQCARKNQKSSKKLKVQPKSDSSPVVVEVKKSKHAETVETPAEAVVLTGTEEKEAESLSTSASLHEEVDKVSIEQK
jgi:hypothetical protein